MRANPNLNTNPQNHYQIKVKIISIHFKIRAINGIVQFWLKMGQKMTDMRQITIKDGLIVESITLQCQLSQKEFLAQHPITIVLVQKTKSNEEAVGDVTCRMQDFKSGKMRRFKLQNCFDNSAYLQAFLLSIPISCTYQPIQQPQSQQYEKPNLTVRKIKQSQASSINICINEQTEQYEQSNIESSLINSRNSSKVDVVSLLTLNQILNDTNHHLTHENNRLKQVIADMQEQFKMQSRLQQSSNKMFANRISQVQKLLLQKQSEIQSKDQTIQKLTLSLQNQQKQLSSLPQKIRREVREEMKADSLVIELSRYTQPTSKPKPKQSTNPKKNETKQLTQIPKIPIFTLSKQNLFKSGKEPPKSSRLYKQASKSMAMSKQKLAGHDETADTMKQHSVILSVK